jgi:hypothetical protein
MARYPKATPKWSQRPYGGYGDAWDEAKDQCRAVLYDLASRGDPTTYSDLVPAVTAIPWPDGAFTHSGRQMGTLLGQLSLDELVRNEDRPVLSSLVIGKLEGMPSGGYWTFIREELGISVPKDDLAMLEFWQAEFKAACSYYGPKAS